MTARHIILGALAGAVFAGLTVFPAGAEPVKIGAAARDDFGRIVFSWNNPVSYQSSVKKGRLTVRFGRPMEADFGRVTRVLGKYVKSASPGSDGQSVIFELKGDFDVYSFDSGSAVIVEIATKETPDNAAQARQAETVKAGPEKETAAQREAKPGPQPAGKAEENSGLPAIRVRSGQHPDYTRIVFDWPRKVAYRFKQEGGIATVSFARAANINLKSIQSRPPRFVGGARSRIGDDGVTVTLSVPATSKIRHFLAGSKVVLDIRPPSGSEKPAPLPPEASLPPEAPPATPEAAAKTAAATAPPKVEAPEKTAGAAPGSGKKPVAPRTAARTAKPVDETAKTETAKSQVEKTSAEEERKTAAAAAPAPSAPSAPGGPTRLMPPTSTPPPAAGAATEAARGPTGLGGPPPLPPTPSQVSIESPGGIQGKPPGPDAVTLRFDWNEPVGAAVFRRAGVLWIAFDKPTAIDIGQLRESGKNIIKGIEQMGTAEGTVLRMKTVAGINPSIRRDGYAWLLDFRKQSLEAETPLMVKAQPDSPIGARLFVPVPEPGSPIGITDPEVGDNIVIVPLIPFGHGIGLEYIYPQLHFLPTAQGLVIQPRIDDIRVRPLREGVEVTSGGELYISSVSAEAEANRQLAEMKPLTRILDLDPWKIKNLTAFLPRKYELLYAISRSKGDQLEAARLDLVRFYFANGFFAEALAIMKEIARERAEVDQDPEYRMLRGVSKYMLGRYVEAFDDFNHEALRVNDEAVFWRAAVRAATGDITNAAPDMKRTGQIIRPYPKTLKLPLGALVTKTALKIGDIKQARHFLEILRLDNLMLEERNQLDLEEGRVLELTGDFDAAIAKWEKVQKGAHPPSRAKATVARMELLLKLKRLTRLEAIKELESLRFSWRGDEFEFNLLRRLGTLYLEEGLYRAGLDRLRQAATYYRTLELAPQVTLQMSDAFTDLYLNDGADVLPPVTAIALYDEFKELTPAGVQGDEMIRKLADRLVGVDLLDRAVALLNSQVRFRLQGVEKARVGTQLALVHILGRDYTSALKVLAETEAPGMPERLVTQRRHLQAKSLIGRKDRGQALAVLKGDKSKDAELLRTEIFWSSRDWSKASQSLRRLLREEQAKPGAALTGRQASHVLSYAIALTLSGNDRALSRARGDFLSAMAKTGLKDAFRLIVTPASLGLLDPNEVAAGVKDVENFQSFMVAYRERLKKQNLSDLVPAPEPEDVKKPGGKPDDKKPGAKEPEAKEPEAKTGDGKKPAPAERPKPAPQA